MSEEYQICGNCTLGEYHGYPPNNSPRWVIGTIYFWCPKFKHHDSTKEACDIFSMGQSKHFDKFGNQLFIHDWHRPYEDNPYVDEVCASLPPKYQWTCSKCGKVVYVNCSDAPEYFGCDK